MNPEAEPNYNFYIAKGRLPVVDRAEGIRLWDIITKSGMKLYIKNMTIGLIRL